MGTDDVQPHSETLPASTFCPTHADTRGPEPITPHLRSKSPVSHNVTRFFRVLHLAAGRETDGTTIFVKGFSREFGGEDEVRQALTEAFADCGEVSQVNGFTG